MNKTPRIALTSAPWVKKIDRANNFLFIFLTRHQINANSLMAELSVTGMPV